MDSLPTRMQTNTKLGDRSNPKYFLEQSPLRLVVVRFDAQDMITTRTSNTIPLQEDIAFNTPLESIFIITSNVSTFTRLIEPTCVPTQLPSCILFLEQFLLIECCYSRFGLRIRTKIRGGCDLMILGNLLIFLSPRLFT